MTGCLRGGQPSIPCARVRDLRSTKQSFHWIILKIGLQRHHTLRNSKRLCQTLYYLTLDRGVFAGRAQTYAGVNYTHLARCEGTFKLWVIREWKICNRWNCAYSAGHYRGRSWSFCWRDNFLQYGSLGGYKLVYLEWACTLKKVYFTPVP